MTDFDFADCLPDLGSDIHARLEDRLGFIERFYTATAYPLKECKRMIEANEEPYRDLRDAENYDGPAFEIEWIEADTFEKTIGFLCLALLNKSLENFVRLFVAREFGINSISKLSRLLKDPKIPERGKTVRFIALLERTGHPNFRWENSPVKKSEIEDITFARNA